MDRLEQEEKSLWQKRWQDCPRGYGRSHRDGGGFLVEKFLIGMVGSRVGISLVEIAGQRARRVGISIRGGRKGKRIRMTIDSCRMRRWEEGPPVLLGGDIGKHFLFRGI